MKKILLVLGISFVAVGCYPTQYSHVEKVDNGYIVTKNQAGFFRVHGEMWHCTPQTETTMVCKEIAEQ